MRVSNRRIRGGLILAVTVVGVFLLAQSVDADGRSGAAFRGAGNCPPDAPCITEVITTGILPYNRPIIRGTAGIDTTEAVITVDGILNMTAPVKDGWFEPQVPWNLKDGEHFVYVRSVLSNGTLSAISNVVTFFITQPLVEPQISATQIEGEDEGSDNATSSSEREPKAATSSTINENGSPSGGRSGWDWGSIVFYAAALGVIGWMLAVYRHRA